MKAASGRLFYYARDAYRDARYAAYRFALLWATIFVKMP
jgi:hypothetical protein